jgi:hypothetical protein
MKRCPTCNQPMPSPTKVIRSCFDCHQPITRHAKWTWQERQGVLTAVHRHCENPESYEPAGEPPKPPHAPLFGEAA